MQHRSNAAAHIHVVHVGQLKSTPPLVMSPPPRPYSPRPQLHPHPHPQGMSAVLPTTEHSKPMSQLFE